MSEMKGNQKTIKPPTYLDALIPIITLVILLASAVYLYGSDGTAGPIQVVLMMSMMVAPQERSHQARRSRRTQPHFLESAVKG